MEQNSRIHGAHADELDDGTLSDGGGDELTAEQHSVFVDRVPFLFAQRRTQYN